MKMTACCLLSIVAGALPGFAAPPPAAPRGVAMTANSPNSVTLDWYRPTVEGVTSYNIYAAAKEDGDFQKVATVKERTATLGSLSPDTKVFYKVTAVGPGGESEKSNLAPAFTFKPCAGASFPARIAKNMCLSLGAGILSDSPPVSGKLTDLVDGSDATTCRLRKVCELKLKLNSTPSPAEAPYLMVHFRTDGGPVTWSNDPFARTLQDYVILESLDSLNGKDGTWKEVATGTNTLLDGVIVIPNHRPKWIAVRSSGGPDIPPSDKRPMPSDLILCRLDIFRAAPAGFRNDYWIFTGDSLVVQDLPGGSFEGGRTAWFSDLIRRQHPDRYPIVVHAARGGEMLKDTLPRMEKIMPALSPDNGTKTPTATVVCWESGFNDVGVGGSLSMGPKIAEQLRQAQTFCQTAGLFMVPVRLEFSTSYLDQATLEPAKANVFVNTLAINLAGVDVFCRESTPYACNPQTQLPFADYWSYTRKNYATALVKDGVHHTKSGSDGINTLWAEVADRMIYSAQK